MNVHLLGSEHNNHVYTKTPTLAYSFHELGDEASFVGIVANLPELRLLIQQYFDIVYYIKRAWLCSYQGIWQATEMFHSPLAAWILL